MQRQMARFHLAIANAIDVLQEELRRKTGRPDAEITSRYADANRERIRDIAQDYLGEKIHLTPPLPLLNGNTRPMGRDARITGASYPLP